MLLTLISSREEIFKFLIVFQDCVSTKLDSLDHRTLFKYTDQDQSENFQLFIMPEKLDINLLDFS